MWLIGEKRQGPTTKKKKILDIENRDIWVKLSKKLISKKFPNIKRHEFPYWKGPEHLAK